MRGRTAESPACQGASIGGAGGEGRVVGTRVSWMIVVLAAVTVVGAVVFTTRGSWGGWMLFGMAVVLVVAAVLDIREKRRGGR